MLNWIKFITVFLVALATVIVVTIYFNANKPISAATDLATNAAVQSGQLVSAHTAQPYNGTESQVTIFGVNHEGEEVAVFVNDATEKDFQEVKMEDGITAKQAIGVVQQEHKVKKILHVSLGMEEEEPVWEVAFKGDDNKLNYVYVFFENGQWWKRILNL